MSHGVLGRGLGYRVDGRDLITAVDVAAAPGELLAILGPNGAGKTTLLRVLSGEWPATTGEVELLGRPLTGLAPIERARLRAVLPQQTVLTFAFRCLDVVLMGRYAATTGDDTAVAEAAMATTDSSHLAARAYPTLSGGEQTRVSLARVLAQETPVLFLDEPTASLDLRHQELVMRTCAAWRTVVRSWWRCSTTSTWRRDSPTGWCFWPKAGSGPWGPPQRCCRRRSSRMSTSRR
jgi:iron complex transport system ATP-binding protein